MRCALGAIALIGTIASSQSMAQKTVITSGEIETATATIRRIDVAKRFVVLRGDDGSAESWKDDYGISEDFVQRVGTMVQPGDSAIFALLRTIDADLVADQFRGYGGTILRTTLSPEQQAKVETTLHSR